MCARRIRHALGAVFAVTVLAATAHAQTVDDWRTTEKDAQKPGTKLQQSYHGVKPGGGNNLPRVEEIKNRPGAWVTWPGFAMKKSGGSRIFLQTTLAIEYEVIKNKRKKAKTLMINLKEAQVYLSNNQNPLVTTYFNTAVNRTYLKKKRKSLHLVIELRKHTVPEISQKTDEDGYHYLFIDFPKGDYAAPKVTNTRPAYDANTPSVQ
jgi:hypothetical protein